MKKKLFSETPHITGKRITIKALTQADAPFLQELMDNVEAGKYLPTFLFEKQFKKAEDVIDNLYSEARDFLILGIYLSDNFCGLCELYGYREEIRKISIGHRLLPRFWDKGISSEALGLMLDYLVNETDIETITASSMAENHASAAVLKKLGFVLVSTSTNEDWGYNYPILTHKWIF